MKALVPILVGLSIVAGCDQMQHVTTSAVPSDWDRTLYNARTAVDAHNYFAADKLLDEYIRTHPGTREANEIAFWKAAYVLDPGNNAGSLADGITQLDAYLTANPQGFYRNEATVLRRTAAVAQGLTNVARMTVVDTLAAPTPRDTVVIVRKSRDEEIATLRDQLAKSKDELAKVSAELERIKKRLANPNG